MTRNEFIDDVTTFYELASVCNDEGLYTLDDYFDGDCLDDEVENDMSELDDGWRSLRDCLNNIETGYDFYERNGYLDYTPFSNGDDRFEELKNEVLEYMDDHGRWDEDDEEDDDDDDTCYDEEYVYKDPEAPVSAITFEEVCGF